jgi:hypothetical protein
LWRFLSDGNIAKHFLAFPLSMAENNDAVIIHFIGHTTDKMEFAFSSSMSPSN